MVFIYGGGFLSGSANPDSNGPEYIMDTEEVIMVVMSYRMSIFGFLSTNDSVVPGNCGMKDQTLALKWVQKNIAAFGGNPKEVTLFGHSAGGSATHLHMLSKLSEGLFNAAISLSGTATLPLTIQEDPERVARITAKACNITNADTITTAELLAALRAQDVSTLFEAVGTITNPLLPYTPVVEHGNSSDAFLPEHPSKILAEGNYKPTRYMTGILPEDGAAIALPIWELENKRNTFNEDFDYELETYMIFPSYLNRSRLDTAVQKITDEYFDGIEELTKEGILNVR